MKRFVMLVNVIILVYCLPCLAQLSIRAVDSLLWTYTDREKLEFFRSQGTHKLSLLAVQRLAYMKEYDLLAQKLQSNEDRIYAEFEIITAERDLSIKTANESIFRYMAILERAKDMNLEAIQPKIQLYVAMTAMDETHDIALAFDYAHQAMETSLSLKDSAALGLALNLIADAFLRSGNPDSALQYCQHSYRVRKQLQEKKEFGGGNLVWTLHNMGLIYEARGYRDSAWSYFTQAAAIVVELEKTYNGDVLSACPVYKHLARLSIQKGNYSAAQLYIDKAIWYCRRLDYTMNYQMLFLTEIAAVLRSLGLYQRALDEAEHALDVANRLHSLYHAGLALRECAVIHAAMGKHERAFQLHEQSRQLSDSLEKLNIARTIFEMSNRIATARKNASLESENRRHEQNRLLFLYVLSMLIFTLVTGSVLLYYRNRGALTRRLLEETERTNRTVMKATLEGIEFERSRIQRELHDGVGVHLSVVKLGLGSFRSAIQKYEPDTLPGFDKSIQTFAEAVEEIRDICQNLSPPLLYASGLAIELEYLIQSVSKEFALQIVLNVREIEGCRFQHDRELFAYRIVQEILHNCLKHADAETLAIHLAIEKRTEQSTSQQWLVITAEDDGKGFDYHNVTKRSMENRLQSGGLGLQTLHNRTYALSGALQIHSERDHGTRIIAEIPIEPSSVKLTTHKQ